MQLALFDQKSRLANRLGEWRNKPLNFTDSSRFPETRTEESVPLRTSASTLENCHLDFLLRYDVFPSSVLNFFGEWQRENRLMRAGDVIIQQANLPPVKWGLKLLFGVRVLSVERTDTRVAFTYGTLKGHPEMGTNEFSFSLAGDQVAIRICTRSESALWIARLFAPIFTMPYVRYCNRKALSHLKAKLMEKNPGSFRAGE
jgi:hypothetical protein